MGTMDEHEARHAGQTVPIRVAEQTSGDPLAAVVAGRDGATLEARYWSVPVPPSPSPRPRISRR